MQNQQINATQTINITHPLPANLKAILYRIVQEGLTNIVKHANARHVQLQLVSSSAVVTLTLEDDGQGFETAKASTGLIIPIPF